MRLHSDNITDRKQRSKTNMQYRETNKGTELNRQTVHPMTSYRLLGQVNAHQVLSSQSGDGCNERGLADTRRSLQQHRPFQLHPTQDPLSVSAGGRCLKRIPVVRVAGGKRSCITHITPLTNRAEGYRPVLRTPFSDWL